MKYNCSSDEQFLFIWGVASVTMGFNDRMQLTLANIPAVLPLLLQPFPPDTPIPLWHIVGHSGN